MENYYLEREFTFGKFKGKTVEEVLDLQPSYIDWCIINLEHFYISESVLQGIKRFKPDFNLTEEGKQKLAYKDKFLKDEHEYNKWSQGLLYQNLNDWLEDAAGSDDPEMMNDAYWNMD